MQRQTIGVDLAKNVFELAISRRPGKVHKRRRLSRARFLPFFAQCEPSVVVMEACGSAHAWGRALRAENPGLVYCAITPFGQTGPYAQYRAHDLAIVAMGGNASMTGDPDAEPLRCSMPTSYFHAAPEAVLGIEMALYARATTGHGQFVDVSMQECQLASLITGAAQYALTHRLGRRSGSRMGRTREIWRAKDGQISYGLRGGPARIPSLVATVEYMAECGMAADWLREFDWERYSPLAVSDQELARLEQAFGAFFESKSMRELYDEALRRRILLAPCNDAREILAQPQLRSRELFRTLDYPALGARIEHPDFFARASRCRIGIRRPAPEQGEHDSEVGDLSGRRGIPVPLPGRRERSHVGRNLPRSQRSSSWAPARPAPLLRATSPSKGPG